VQAILTEIRIKAFFSLSTALHAKLINSVKNVIPVDAIADDDIQNNGINENLKSLLFTIIIPPHGAKALHSYEISFYLLHLTYYNIILQASFDARVYLLSHILIQSHSFNRSGQG